MLRFGYNRGLPAGTKTAWGCRAVVTEDSAVHVIWGRIRVPGPETEQLVAYLHDLPLRGDWQNRAMERLRAGVMDGLSP